jgi:hypothetical protein
MKISELQQSQQLDEIAALMNMANWFAQKYHNVISKGSQKLGQGEVQKFTNKHLRTFMQMMGRYQVDWPTVTMYVIYQYLRLVMKLSDQDILDVVNTTMRDPKVKSKKILTIQQVKDQNKDTLPSSFSTTGGDPAKTNQLIAQMIVAGGAMRQLERHWETQVGATKEPAKDHSTDVRQRASRSKPATATQTTQTTAPPPASTIDAALAQLGVTV